MLLRFVPGWTQGLTTTVQAKPLPSLGWGLVTFIGVFAVMTIVPIVAFLLSGLLAFVLPYLILPVVSISILFAMCIGIALAVFATCIPQIIVSLLGGRWLIKKLRPNHLTGKMMSLFVGLVVFVLLSAIPVFGGILDLICVLISLGAVWLWGRREISNIRHQELTPV
ncbi:MAG: hypothetical protein WBA07_14145 [Rivularia sp. (in: cyanobacteria)]